MANATFDVVDTFGHEHTLIGGQLDVAARETFLCGQCHSLALAIHDRAPDSWTLAALRSDAGSDDDLVVHVAVRTDDGWLVDIDNVHDDQSMLDAHGAAARIEPISRQEVVDLAINGDLPPLRLDLGHAFVDAALANAGYDPATFEPA